MKTPCLIIYLFLLVSPLFGQQRNSITLKELNDKEIITYSTTESTILFRKSDVMRIFEWNTPITEKEKNAVKFLKDSKKVDLIESNKKVSENEQVLTQLMQEKIILNLMTKGMVEVIRRSDDKKQQIIFYEIESLKSGDKYQFLFNDGKSFFTAYSQPVKTAVNSAPEEVVFDDSEQIQDDGDEDKIFTIIEEQPDPIGGMTLFQDYLIKNLKYPKKAKKEKLEGISFISFVVDADGSLSEFTAVKGLSPECDQEAIRLIKAGGNWKPGKQNGKARKVRFVLPVKFKLSK